MRRGERYVIGFLVVATVCGIASAVHDVRARARRVSHIRCYSAGVLTFEATASGVEIWDGGARVAGARISGECVAELVR